MEKSLTEACDAEIHMTILPGQVFLGAVHNEAHMVEPKAGAAKTALAPGD
jgi:hypothetical protein